MSVQAITAALKFDGVTASEKLLMIVLANYADEHGVCWPSQSRLARETAMTDRTIRRLMVSLEGRKLVSRRARYKNASRSSDAITLLFIPDTMSAPPDKRRTSYRTSATVGADTMSAKPIREPKKEPSSARESEPVNSLSRAQMAEQLRDLAKGMRKGVPMKDARQDLLASA